MKLNNVFFDVVIDIHVFIYICTGQQSQQLYIVFIHIVYVASSLSVWCLFNNKKLGQIGVHYNLINKLVRA